MKITINLVSQSNLEHKKHVEEDIVARPKGEAARTAKCVIRNIKPI